MLLIDDVLANNLKKHCIGRQDRIAIYGTGEGAKEVFAALRQLGLEKQFRIAIDRDDSGKIGEKIFERPVCSLCDVTERADVILIAARVNHLVIRDRIKEFFGGLLNTPTVIDPYMHRNTREDEIEYVHYLEESRVNASRQFVPFKNGDYIRKETDTRIIAWYLPQFHQIEINNRFHGRGFTEWTNTSQAFPQFCGHYQPHIPYDVGYYDLMNIETLKRQACLAHDYGIYGFAFHYYWFSGKRLMEKPLELLMAHKEINIPFCINWANENWTSVWDGGNQDIMYEQGLDDGDDEKFMRDLLPLLNDPRYIKIDGRPLISIYRGDIFDKERLASFIKNIRGLAGENEIPELFVLVTTATRSLMDPHILGADGLVEFPPHGIARHARRIQPEGYLNPYFRGNIYDMEEFIENRRYMVPYDADIVFRTAMVGFDNTARRGMSAAGIFYGMDPGRYKKWLLDILWESKKEHPSSMDVVFVNGWNEWAEGAHLEPDMKYGYAYLEATKQALLEVRQEKGDGAWTDSFYC